MNTPHPPFIKDDPAGYEIQTAGSTVSYLLDQIPDKPNKVHLAGDPTLLNDKSLKFLCVIGSRKHTLYGREACETLIRSLASSKVAIVSGLALGIDGLAHEVALDVGLPCIAVPGSAIDQASLYPRSHTDLAERIVKNGGLILSELEPGTKASPWSFPMRNRIMAGLSHAVLIIEGEEDSGTLITARLALEYNRDVLAIPGPIFSPASRGPLNLIKGGAVPICSPSDLKAALGIVEGSLFS
ncbi:MAG TPA: DNA-processing protein DprA [Candidatus Paceibacterota bacterium]